MSRNPYQENPKEPKLKSSVFVFMDILGYKEMITEAQKNKTDQELLVKLHHALSGGRAILERDLKIDSEYVDKDLFAFKGFTDNIVIGIPISGDGEMELGDAFGKVAEFQLQMVLQGFFLRGAISIGQAFIDDIAVFGDALNQSYLGECTLARDPRIILTESAVNAVDQHLEYYGRKKFAPQARDLLKDADGQIFVNYLDMILIAEEESGPFYDFLAKHKDSVEKKLKDFKNAPPIFAKYSWVAEYHNFYCDLHKHHFSDEHKINTDLFRAPPSLIVD